MNEILQMLTTERDRLSKAIAILDNSTVTPKRRGRPPMGLTVVPASAPAPKSRWSAAQRKATSQRMRAYWAAMKNGKKK
jgi:hypothetical protein